MALGYYDFGLDGEQKYFSESNRFGKYGACFFFILTTTVLLFLVIYTIDHRTVDKELKNVNEKSHQEEKNETNVEKIRNISEIQLDEVKGKFLFQIKNMSSGKLDELGKGTTRKLKNNSTVHVSYILL